MSEVVNTVIFGWTTEFPSNNGRETIQKNTLSIIVYFKEEVGLLKSQIAWSFYQNIFCSFFPPNVSKSVLISIPGAFSLNLLVPSLPGKHIPYVSQSILVACPLFHFISSVTMLSASTFSFRFLFSFSMVFTLFCYFLKTQKPQGVGKRVRWRWNKNQVIIEGKTKKDRRDLESLVLGREDGRGRRNSKIAWREWNLPTGFNWGKNHLCSSHPNMIDNAN